jgi:hypothetical protein
VFDHLPQGLDMSHVTFLTGAIRAPSVAPAPRTALLRAQIADDQRVLTMSARG